MKNNERNKNRYNSSDKASKGGDTVSRDSYTHYPGDAIQAIPLEVKIFGNNFERALKAFRALVQKERILSTYKEKQTYEKASDKRRRKRAESKRKSQDECTKGHCAHTDSHGKPKNSSAAGRQPRNPSN